MPFPPVAHTSEVDTSVARARECSRAGPSASERVRMRRVNGKWDEAASLGPSARKPNSFFIFFPFCFLSIQISNPFQF
jgi:hypothetical protein